MTAQNTHEQDRRRFRSAAIKVLSIQVVSLIVLWVLQRSFS
jgi:hypothetical protein